MTEAPGPTSYTDIYSQTDDLVQPAMVDPTAALRGGANVANVAVQAVCPGRYVNHGGMLADAVVYALVMDTLNHRGPASPARIPVTDCTQTFTPGVSPAAAIAGNAMVYSSAASAFSAHSGVNSRAPAGAVRNPRLSPASTPRLLGDCAVMKKAAWWTLFVVLVLAAAFFALTLALGIASIVSGNPQQGDSRGSAVGGAVIILIITAVLAWLAWLVEHTRSHPPRACPGGPHRLGPAIPIS